MSNPMFKKIAVLLATLTAGAVLSYGLTVSAGTVYQVIQGGTGASTLTGWLSGNGTSPFTASTSPFFSTFTFGNATGTNLFATKGNFTTLCIAADCKTAWPASGGGSGTVGTSTSETAGYWPYWTTTSGSPALLGATSTPSFANMFFTNATGTNATTTNFFSTTASSTNLFATNANLGSLTVSGQTTLLGLTPSRIVATDGSGNLVSTITAANLRASVNGSVTGTAGNLVFSGGPSFTGTTSFVNSTNSGTLQITGQSSLGDLLVTGSSTLQNVTFTNATGTNATTTNFFSTTASSTNLFSSLLTVGGNHLVVNAAGNVGIGTANPNYLLDINGTVGIGASSNSNGVGLVLQKGDPGSNVIMEFRNTAGTRQAAMGIIGTAGQYILTGAVNDFAWRGSGNILFGNNTTGAEYLRITTTGNVGIGTAAPNFKLEVNGTASTTSFFATNATTTNATSTNLFATTASSTSLFTSSLGIASSTPSTKLSLGSGAIAVAEYQPATSTSMTIDWRNGNQQLVQIGTSATTIASSNYVAGQHLTLLVCNPPSGTGGAVTFTGVLWPGGTAPTTTTTAKKCDIVSMLATNGTSTLVILGGYNQNY